MGSGLAPVRGKPGMGRGGSQVHYTEPFFSYSLYDILLYFPFFFEFITLYSIGGNVFRMKMGRWALV